MSNLTLAPPDAGPCPEYCAAECGSDDTCINACVIATCAAVDLWAAQCSRTLVFTASQRRLNLTAHATSYVFGANICGESVAPLNNETAHALQFGQHNMVQRITPTTNRRLKSRACDATTNSFSERKYSPTLVVGTWFFECALRAAQGHTRRLVSARKVHR